MTHEAPLTSGFGAEVVSTLAQRCFWRLESPPLRVAGAIQSWLVVVVVSMYERWRSQWAWEAHGRAPCMPAVHVGAALLPIFPGVLLLALGEAAWDAGPL